ncbi:MAG: CrcB family protein [Brachybacterium sp.]|uniref:CrcB family protein n=1 Tax=Brachybacterium sp. TaxID=1891286 RepID=UPI00264918F4|nr:CrcB family protein [Brachybacterium sp.]MDN5687246.1 CrcB family protein [Brachybacterium sp.]
MSARPRPAHRRPGLLALVALGGAAGTACRAGLNTAIPDVGGVSSTILLINVLGAFLLGLLLDSLARRGPDQGGRQRMRLLLGTGFLGGFTTYSTLATHTALLGGGSPAVGIAYGLTTVLAGGLATWAGIAVAAALRPRPATGTGTAAAPSTEVRR